MPYFLNLPKPKHFLSFTGQIEAKNQDLPYHDKMFRMLDQWLQMLFSGIALCLALEFMLRIFAPGNGETAWIFQALHPAQPVLDTICYYLTQPVDKTGELINNHAPWLLQWIPRHLKACFPVIPAEGAAKNIAHWLLLFPHNPHGRYAQDIMGAHYGQMFPGVVDFRLMLALPLWNWAESLLSGCIQWIETLFYRHSLRQQDKAAIKSLQTQWEPQNPKEQHAS